MAVIALLAMVLLFSAVGCAPPSPTSSARGPEGGGDQSTRPTKTLTIGIVGNAEGFGLAGSGGPPGGGWASASEVHSNGLITSDVQSRKPIGELAASVPTLEDGTMALLPDGRVRVTFRLRSGVTWQDGERLSARDMLFSYRIATDQGLPFVTQARQVANQLDAAEAPDDATFVLTFKKPYYQAATLGLRPFWPYPRHILEQPYERYLETGNLDEFMSLPYWTKEYVHAGPFRLSVFDPGEGLTFTAYDGYFRGRPKIDVVTFKFYTNDNVLFSSLLAGAADMFLDSTLRADLEDQIAGQWKGTGEGEVRSVVGDGGRYLNAQMRPEYQAEASALDPRVRGALYEGIDRDAFAEAMHRPGLGAYGIRPPGDLFYDATKDAFRRYPYDPSRARSDLQALGWESGTDGLLHSVGDGRA